MKKLIAIVTLSVFTLGVFAASTTPAMQKDTTKTKKDTSKTKKDTTKKPKPAARR